MDAPQTHIYNMIYVFKKDDIHGALKIGKTTVEAKRKEDLSPNCSAMEAAFSDRMKSAATWGVTDIRLLYTEVACYDASDGEHRFDDHEIHKLLENSHYKKRIIETPYGEGNEWFEVDLETVKKAIAAYKEGRAFIDGPIGSSVSKKSICFRDEQEDAILRTINHYSVGDKMLWNAKMRFGKTLCALEVVLRQKYKKTLILTHRPTVRSGWYEDFHNLEFQGYLYGSKDGSKDNQCDKWKTIENGKEVIKIDTKGKDFESLYNESSPYIYFASMQDLRGSRYIFGDNEKNSKGAAKGFNKNDKVFENDWDLIILDEAHEGTRTDLGQRVINKLLENKSPKLLYLSGTPYNILHMFQDEEIYTWDYVMEQNAKESWDYSRGQNPYEGLAKMHIYTYDLNEVYAKNKEIYTKDDYFSFAEFFRVWTGDSDKDGEIMPSNASVGGFVHEKDVRMFLDLMCSETEENYYPFSNDLFCEALNHTFWLVPGVKQASALELMINNHRLHKELGFNVINVAGAGSSISEVLNTNESSIKTIEEEEKKERNALEKVKKGVKQFNRTITLSCGRLTTGVSIPEWTGVFMLAGGYKANAAPYMQTIFRSQTPYKGGAIKSNCYAFDFAPDRTLTVVHEYIGMQPRNSKSGENTDPLANYPKTPSNGDTESVLRYMPVIAMRGGQEITMNTQEFVLEVNRSYSDFVRAHKFKGRALTRDFSNWSKKDHDLLAEIGKLFSGGTIKLNSDGTVVVADNGETGSGGPKKTKKGTRMGQSISTGKKKKNKDSDLAKKSQKVLDQIYVRFPLLMFGAVEDDETYTTEKFLSDEVIDESSWKQFMPDGFTKSIFAQISHLIKLEALMASGISIIKDLKKADNLPIEERVSVIAQMIAGFHYADNETVLTPWNVVNLHMADTLGGYDFYDESHLRLIKPRLVDKNGIATDIFCKPEARILELNSKSGVYPLWLAFTLWKLQGHDGLTLDEEWSLWKTIVENNLFVVCKTKMAERITQRVLVGYRTNIQTNTLSIENIIERAKDDSKQLKLINEIKDLVCTKFDITREDMKFDAVVSNPPYQMSVAKKKTANGQKRVSNIFHHFQILADSLGRYSSLIYPGGRWIHQAGKGVEKFGYDQINDKRLRLLEYFSDASKIFKDAGIADGISIVLKDSEKTTEGFNYIYNGGTTYPMASPGSDLMILNPLDDPYARCIREVVAEKSFCYLHDSVLSQKLFNIESDFVEKNKELVREYNEGDQFDNKSEIKLFTNDKAGKAGRAKWYVTNRSVISDELYVFLDKWKVVVSSANAGGQKRGNQIAVLDNFSAFGRSRVALKTFSTKEEADNFFKYANSELIRYAFLLTDESLTSLAKLVPDIGNYRDDNGIIDFSGDIDSQLYALFKISDSSHIKSVLSAKIQMVSDADENDE